MLTARKIAGAPRPFVVADTGAVDGLALIAKRLRAFIAVASVLGSAGLAAEPDRPVVGPVEGTHAPAPAAAETQPHNATAPSEPPAGAEAATGPGPAQPSTAAPGAGGPALPGPGLAGAVTEGPGQAGPVTAASGQADPAAGGAEAAQRAYDAGRLADAIGIWAKLSLAGDSAAELHLAQVYDEGRGTPPDPAVALHWYEQAAEAGVREAEFTVGAMYDQGRGVARSSETAALWYAKAAAHGDTRAQTGLARLYQQGDGVPRNQAVAGAWLQLAADAGVADARRRLQDLQAVTARSEPASSSPSDHVTQVIQSWPMRGATLTVKPQDPTVVLVWVAPHQPQPVHYEVQVRDMGEQSMPVIWVEQLDQTATVVRLPADNSFYAWSVDAVTQDGSHLNGTWNWFSIGSVDGPRAPFPAAIGVSAANH